MLLDPAIQLRSLSIGFEEFPARFGRAERGSDNHAVGWSKALSGQPSGQLADQPPVFVMEPKLNRLPYPAPGRSDMAARFVEWLRLRQGGGLGLLRRWCRTAGSFTLDRGQKILGRAGFGFGSHSIISKLRLC
jgi:hypothetical protein